VGEFPGRIGMRSSFQAGSNEFAADFFSFTILFQPGKFFGFPLFNEQLYDE
jgi:hypothetical protein